LKEREQWATEVICFHAQQCVEKYLKALLVLNRTDFPKTHDIRRLTGMLPPRLRPDLSEAERDTMTLYATVILLLRHTSSFEPSVIGHPFDAMGAVVQSSVPRRGTGLRLRSRTFDVKSVSAGTPAVWRFCVFGRPKRLWRLPAGFESRRANGFPSRHFDYGGREWDLVTRSQRRKEVRECRSQLGSRRVRTEHSTLLLAALSRRGSDLRTARPPRCRSRSCSSNLARRR
jgi:hypothetical protein